MLRLLKNNLPSLKLKPIRKRPVFEVYAILATYTNITSLLTWPSTPTPFQQFFLNQLVFPVSLSKSGCEASEHCLVGLCVVQSCFYSYIEIEIIRYTVNDATKQKSTVGIRLLLVIAVNADIGN